MNETNAAALRMAARAGSDKRLHGFDPMTLIAIFTTLIPMLTKCFEEKDPPQIKAKIARDYDVATGRYNDDLWHRACVAAKKAAKKQGKPLNRDQLAAAAKAVLDEARLGSAETARGVMAENA